MEGRWWEGGVKEKRIGRIISRLSGRFASILYFNCEHFLFVYIVKQEQKKFADLILKNRGFSKLNGNRILLEAIYYFDHPNLPLVYVRSHTKFGPDWFSRFDVYWIQTNIQTNKQTDRQAKFIYIFFSFFS